MNHFGGFPRKIALGVFAFILLWGCQAEARASPKVERTAFLQSQLPLRLIVTTPTELAGNTGLTPVNGRQALTAVFSRPVIALGSDFGQPGAPPKFPFSLSCGVPGKSRWVTTTIARFDPDVDWPTDLDCELAWATNTTTYDGAVLSLGDTAPKRRLSTFPQSMWLDDVTSAQASNLTDGVWGAYANGQWEVPPDGKILVSFSHPVNLRLLRTALKVVEASQPGDQGVAFEVGPCQSAAPWTFYATGRTSSSSSSSSSSSGASGFSLDVNTTCAEVSPRSQLKPATTYLLVMIRGSRYHSLAGPLQEDLNVTVTGLQPFRLPFNSDNFKTVGSGTRYRRLDLWLPHGLSNDTAPEALASRISLCRVVGASSCTPTPFALSMVSRARARLNVSTLQPRTQYRISVAADPLVKDGFGQGLQTSDLTFWSGAVSYAFAAPRLDASVAVLEPGAEPLSSWPVVTRGVGPVTSGGEVVSSIRAWELDLSDENVQARAARALPQYGFTNADLPTLFGKPTETLTVPPALLSTAEDAPDWTRLELPLRGGSRPSRACIVSYKSAQGYTQYVKLILNTSLSLSVVHSGQKLTAWVLNSAPGGGPLAGAAVTLFRKPIWGGSKEDASLLAKCVTNSDGLCTMTYSESDFWELSAFAVAGNQFAVLDSAGFTRGPTQPPAYVASLVADRLVVVPGDSVKITGFVQRVTPDGLELPAATYGALQVQPRWQLAPSAAASGAAAGAGVATSAVQPSATRGLLQSDAIVVEKEGAREIASDSLNLEGMVVVEMRKNVGATMGKPASTSAPTAFAVKVNGTTGTFQTEITVPKGVRLQPYTFVLGVPPPGTPEADPTRPEPAPGDPMLMSWDAVPAASLTIVVADPRPPTADLKLVAPHWSFPNATVTFNVTAVSYIGASVGGAPLTATWRTAKASGLLALTTDDNGVATGSIELGALPPANVTEPYDGDLSIDVEWIGPTRERITRSTSVILADGPARLQLQLSLTPSTPGTAFALAATLTSNADGAPLTDLPVTATLRPHPNDTAPPPACVNRLPAPCILPSGAPFSPSSCQLALPCVGRFLMEACADVPNSPSSSSAGWQLVCVRQELGRNASQWAETPRRGHDYPGLFTDKPSYKLGEVVRVRFQNSWPGARLLLHWGNEFRSRSTVIPSLPAGLAEVNVGPLGNEALGGATLLAVVDVPRLPPPSAAAANATATATAAATAAAVAQPPTSPLFDPLAPHSFNMRATLNVRPDNALAVRVSVDAAAGNANKTIRDVSGFDVLAVEPGATAQITVSVRNLLGASGGGGSILPAPGSVEVTVYGVDKAFLDLLPYDLPQPELQMVLQLAAEASAFNSAAYRLAPGAVRAVYDKLMARLTKLDPWLPLDTGLRPMDGCAVDVNDTTYLGLYDTPLTEVPTGSWYGRKRSPDSTMAVAAVAMEGMSVSKGGNGGAFATADTGLVMSASGGAAAANSGSGSGGGGSGGGAVSVRLSSDFVVTPLFATVTADVSGRARVNFTAPQNLGTFVIRAFAASGSSASYGSGEGRVAVRRRLSLTPSLPRFVRVGDNFSAGVIVTVGSAPATVAVTIKLSSTASASATPLALTGAASQTVTFSAGGGLQQEVRFSFSAGAIGSSNLTFSAQDGQPGGAADALQSELQVVGQQGEVWVATSFALSAMPPSINGSGGGLQWQEGMELPAAVPGSGGLNLTAGVGYFPAISAMYDTLMQTDADRLYASAVPAMMWATLPAVLSYYGQPISAARAERAKGGFTDLAKLTRSVLGLLWSDPDRWYGWQPTRTDIGLNTWALFLAAQHGPALLRRDLPSLAPSLAPLAASWASLESGSIPSWRAAVARQLVDDAVESRQRPYSPGPYNDWDTLAWVRLVLGGSWVPSDVSKQIRDDLSLATLIANNQSMSRQTRVLTSLVLQSMGPSNPSPRLLAATIDEVTSALRTQGRTAYVAAGSGAAAASSLEHQALSLLLLLRAGVTHQLLPKLAAYVANPPPAGGYGIFYVGCSPREQALAVAALSEYDRVRGSSKPNVELAADVNGVAVLVASFKPGGNPQPVGTVTPWEDIPPPPRNGVSKLNFQAVGSGEVTVAASLRFVPSQLLPFPSYRGLFVEAALQLADPTTGGPTGQRLAAVPLGSVVVLTVQLTSPDDLGPVTLSVLMPAGLEPLDPNLDKSSAAGGAGLRLSCGADWVDSSSWYSFFRWWWWPVCPSQETRPSLVTFSYLALRAGTSSVSLRAVASTPGSFVFPPIRASADDQPELAGSTAATTLTVCADCAAPSFAGPLPLPIACQNDCSGNGVCNLRTGRCRCDAGYTRADCSRPAL